MDMGMRIDFTEETAMTMAVEFSKDLGQVTYEDESPGVRLQETELQAETQSLLS